MITLEIKTRYRNVSVPIKIWSKKKNKFEEIDALFDTGAHASAIDRIVFLNLGYDLDEATKSIISTATQIRDNSFSVLFAKSNRAPSPKRGSFSHFAA